MTCVLTNLSFSASRSLNRLLFLGLMLLVVFRAFGPVAPSIDGHVTDGPSTMSRDGPSNLALCKKV
jgi:hypothetical protein